MKIYIVTQGCYSDYRIKKVFTNKELAERYAELHTKSTLSSECRVETYDTCEEYNPENTYYNVFCNAQLEKRYYDNTKTYAYKLASVNIEVCENETQENEYTNLHKTLRFGKSWDILDLIIQRTYSSKNITEEEAENKVNKIAEDISSQLCYELNNGASVEDVIKLLDENFPCLINEK